MDNRLVRLRPRSDTIYMARNCTVLATAPDGFVHGEANHGLFVHRTRFLSRYRYLINGKPPNPVALSNLDQHSWLGYYIITSPGLRRGEDTRILGPAGVITQQTLELRSARIVGDGLEDNLYLTNYTQHSISFRLDLEIDADFADPSETRDSRQQRGKIDQNWRADERELRIDYSARHRYRNQSESGLAEIHRVAVVRIQAASPVRFGGHRFSFKVALAQHEEWRMCLTLQAKIEGDLLVGPTACADMVPAADPFEARRQFFISNATAIDSPRVHDYSAAVIDTLTQACQDLSSLRLYDLDLNDRHWTVAAGLPVYLALFGRDTLTTSWQAGILSPDLLIGTLGQLARWQGTEINDWRDEQPGRMIHEIDTAPLPSLRFGPTGRYYGSITTSGFYPVVVSALWHWTGDKELVRTYVDPAMKALRWVDEYADLDGDGFYEYETRSTQGLRNQGWKDSDDAIVHADGTQAKPPIATCEEQAFIYVAKLHMAA